MGDVTGGVAVFKVERAPLSHRILTAITQSTRPPRISAQREIQERLATLLPICNPRIVKSPATIPIMIAGAMIETSIMERDKPTARASRLVAMESTARVMPLVESFVLFSVCSSIIRDSRIILPPTSPE